MPRFEYQSVGGAATNELQRILAERDAKRRQDLIDSIALRREDRNDVIQRENSQSLNDSRQATEDAKRLEMAKTVRGQLTMGQEITPGIKQQLGILAPAVVNPEAGFNKDFTDTVDIARGTPEEITAQKHKEATQRILDDSTTPDAVKRGLQYELATGKTAPAGSFDKKEPAKTAAVQEYEYYVEQEKLAGRTPKSFAAYQEMDANWKRPVTPRLSDQGFSPQQTITFNQIAGAYQRSPLMRASDRTVVLRDAAANIEKNPNDAASQLALAYGWIQALDTYQSAVREGELQLAGSIATRWQTLQMEANKVATQGAIMPPDVAKLMAANSRELIRTIESGKKQKEREFASQAKVSGVGDMWDKYVAGFSPEPTTPPPAAATTPAAPATAPIVNWGKDASGKPVRVSQ